TIMEGRGSAHVNGSTYDFHQLQITLQKNDRLTIHALLYGADRRDVIFTGHVSDFGRRTARLSADIDNVSYGRDTDSADAMCAIEMTASDRSNTVTITGRTTIVHNNASLDFVSNGHLATDPNDDNRDHDRDHNRDHDNNRWTAAGRYVDFDQWQNRRDN